MDQGNRKTPLCVAPFLSAAIWADGASTICCDDKSPPAGRVDLVDDLSEIINSEQRCNIRKQFMNGEIPDGCRACIEESKYQQNIFHYYRYHFNWEDIADNYNKVDGTVRNIQYLLLALSNLCTYSCRMCGGRLSTRLDSDLHTMLGHPKRGYQHNDIDKIIRFIRSNPIHTVTFHGGNPINEPRFLDVIDALPSGAMVEILTNGSTLQSGGKDIRPHLERFKQVKLIISVDGTRETTEYIRVHSDFDVVSKHLEEAKDLSNTIVNIHNTITNLNVFNLPAYYSMVLWGELASADAISSYIVTEPAIYCLWNLPDKLRQRAKDYLEEFLRMLEGADRSGPVPASKFDVAHATVRSVIRRLDTAPFDDRLFSEFLNMTKATDGFYGFQSLPYLKDYYDSEIPDPPEAVPANAAAS